MAFKIAMLQDRPGSGIRPRYLEILKRESPDILALPEYYHVGYADDSVLGSCFRRDKIISELLKLSSDLKCVLVGGSLVEHINAAFVNRSYVMNSGAIIGYYDKIHPYDNEGRGLIKPGYEYRVFSVRGIRIGILICADALYPGSFSNIRGLAPDLIIVPTTSPYRENESRITKFRRDQALFAEGAEQANASIFKVCASGQIAGHKLQGRSLIAQPGKIVWRIEPQFESRSALIVARMPEDISGHHLDIKVHWD